MMDFLSDMSVHYTLATISLLMGLMMGAFGVLQSLIITPRKISNMIVTIVKPMLEREIREPLRLQALQMKYHVDGTAAAFVAIASAAETRNKAQYDQHQETMARMLSIETELDDKHKANTERYDRLFEIFFDRSKTRSTVRKNKTAVQMKLLPPPLVKRK